MDTLTKDEGITGISPSGAPGGKSNHPLIYCKEPVGLD